MQLFQIEYNFSWEGNGKANFRYDLSEDSIAVVNDPPENLPEWTELDHFKCMNCPLDSEKISHCPAASFFVPVVEKFRSVDPGVLMEVETLVAGRRIIQSAEAQRAIGSIIGLLFACSGCPHTIYFRPMVKYHVPLSTGNETMMRVASMFTLAQYFNHMDGGEPDMDLNGLRGIYEELQIVNTTMAERLHSADGKDTSVNAMILLDMYSKTMPCQIDDSLQELRYLFRSFHSLPSQKHSPALQLVQSRSLNL